MPLPRSRFLVCPLGLVGWILLGTPASLLAQSTSNPRLAVSASAGYQGAPTRFDTTLQTPLNLETETIAAAYAVKGGALVDVGASVRAWRRFSVGLALTRFSKAGGADVTAQLPHPFFYNEPRAIDGAASGVRREEIAVHVTAAWTVPLGTAIEVRVFGGPTIVRVRQPLVSGVTYDESYPFDAATFSSAPVASTRASAGGFNVGADASYYLHRRIGIGLVARYVRATVDLKAGQTSASVKAGGAQVAAGVRLRF